MLMLMEVIYEIRVKWISRERLKAVIFTLVIFIQGCHIKSIGTSDMIQSSH